MMRFAKLGDYFDAHGAGGAADALGGSFDCRGVHIGHLLGGDGDDLLLGDLTLLVLIGGTGTLLDAGSLQQEDRSGRSLRDEGEGAVRVNRDNDWDRKSGHRGVLGALV